MYRIRTTLNQTNTDSWLFHRPLHLNRASPATPNTINSAVPRSSGEISAKANCAAAGRAGKDTPKIKNPASKKERDKQARTHGPPRRVRDVIKLCSTLIP